MKASLLVFALVCGLAVSTLGARQGGARKPARGGGKKPQGVGGKKPQGGGKKPGGNMFTTCASDADCSTLTGTSCVTIENKGMFCLKPKAEKPAPVDTPKPVNKPVKANRVKCKSDSDCAALTDTSCIKQNKRSRFMFCMKPKPANKPVKAKRVKCKSDSDCAALADTSCIKPNKRKKAMWCMKPKSQ